MIHPNPKVPVEEARKHAKEYRITTPVVIDQELAISRRVKATVTPQAFVFVRDQEQAAYQGRIDNLYAGYGKKRKVATTHELAEALEAVATGGHVQMPKTKAVGCFISYPKQTDSEKSSEVDAG